MGTVIGITGTPGTGKKSVAPLVAAILGLTPASLPPLPKGVHSVAEDLSVDTDKARREIQKHPPSNVVVYGHLLPYVLPPRGVARMVVLRCEPSVLKDRLSRRGYPPVKVTDNVEAELIGVIAADATAAFGRGRTLEFDTTSSTPESAARVIARRIRDREPAPSQIDWLPSYDSARKLKSLLSPSPLRRG
ncbi:MAG TPA: AAA family ATPase [Nitrososphaerales archaeon]|nr:AAA family ATPase [Nitrososphaerales archaeon]